MHQNCAILVHFLGGEWRHLEGQGRWDFNTPTERPTESGQVPSQPWQAAQAA